MMTIAQSIEDIPLLQGDDAARVEKLKKTRSKIRRVLDDLNEIQDHVDVCRDALISGSDNGVQVSNVLYLNVNTVIKKQILRLQKVLVKMGAGHLASGSSTSEGDCDVTVLVDIGDTTVLVDFDEDDLEEIVKRSTKTVRAFRERKNDTRGGGSDSNTDHEKVGGEETMDQKHGE